MIPSSTQWMSSRLVKKKYFIENSDERGEADVVKKIVSQGGFAINTKSTRDGRTRQEANENMANLVQA